MTCAEVEIRLADYLDGTAAPEMCARLESHCEGCQACAGLLSAAGEGLALLREIERVEPPADLLTRLSFQAPTGRLREAWEEPGPLSRWLRPLLEPVLKPRLAMGMAMTILSFAMLDRCAGVRVEHVQAADLNPGRVWSNFEGKVLRTRDRAVKYYENLRWVYEVEVQLNALRNGNGANSLARPEGGRDQSADRSTNSEAATGPADAGSSKQEQPKQEQKDTGR